jgi:hypothetical protein
MKRQLGPILVVLALLYGPAAWSQSGSTDSSQSGSADSSQSSSTDSSQSGSSDSSQGSAATQSGSSGAPGGFTPSSPNLSPSDDSSPQTSNGPQPAFAHPEQLPPLALLNEVTSNTGVRFSFSTGLSGDSNASGAPQTDWLGLASVSGTFGITQIRPKFNWSLNYGGGTMEYLGGGNYSSYLTQSGTAGFLWQLAKRWQFSAQDSYLYSSDPFAPYLTLNYLPTFNQPNPTVYLPQATYQTNTGTADLTYMLGPHDTLDFSGYENFARYQQSVSQELLNSFMWAGSAFYEHRFSARYAAGGGYNFTALDFGHGESRAGVQTFQGFLSYQIKPGMSISGWVGPELTNVKDIVPVFCIPGYGCYYEAIHSSYFDVAEGATFTWATPHSAAHLQFSHRVTNGGPLLGVVRLYSVTADYRRPLSPRWAFLSGIQYGNNVSISVFQANEYINSIAGQAGVSRSINQAWTANAYYALIDQRQNNVPGFTTPHWIDNRIAISLQYNWGHTLGR